MPAQKKKLLFIFHSENEPLWRDGLWAALNALKKDFEIFKFNLFDLKQDHELELPIHPDEADFVLGWGAFGSPADKEIQDRILTQRDHYKRPYKTGLCIAGNAVPPTNMHNYDVLFYETEWYKPQISSHPNIIHAFGTNTDIFHPQSAGIEVPYPKVFDYLTVGSFSNWKRQTKMNAKIGVKMAIGQIQKGNLPESLDIIGSLLFSDCGVSDMVSPTTLSKFYSLAKTVYIPAEINGGGERAILEARACGASVEIEPDNPKLKELLSSPIWNHHYYAAQLKKGIDSCLK